MRGRIDFRHDKTHDIVIATPHWKIETEADVLEWYEQWVAFLKPLNRKVDLIIVLDHADVKASIGSFWGQYRAKVHQQYTRFNFRVHMSKNMRLFANTSGARYNVATEEAATVEDAIEGILAQRRDQKTA
jgi:hypothetical protein